MKVTVVGAGEAFDSGIGNNSFVVHGRGLPTVLVDCGYQVPERLWAAGLHRGLDAVYLTHTHADHSFGMTPLLGRFVLERRERPLAVIGHSGVAAFVRRLLDLGYPGMRRRLPFALEFIAVSPRRRLEFGALTLACARSDHGSRNLSVRFEARGSSCAFSGDGAPTPATEALYRGVDVLFHELYTVRRKVPGHSTLAELRTLAARAGVGRMVVSHHARLHKARLHRAVAAIREPGREWTAARPGDVVRIGRPAGSGKPVLTEPV